MSGVLNELVSIARASSPLQDLPLLTAQLQAVAASRAGDTRAAAQAAVTQGQPLLLAATGWALAPPPTPTSAKRQREASAPASASARCLLCATCQASVTLRRASPASPGVESKRARSSSAADVGSVSFRDAALRAVRASDAAVASASGAAAGSGAASTPSKPPTGSAVASPSPQSSPLSSSLAREFSPPGSASHPPPSQASAYGLLHPLLAHRSSCPWVTLQSMQRQRAEQSGAATHPSGVAPRSVAQLGEASLRAVETVAALSAGGVVPASGSASEAPLQTVSKPGWKLYVDALCDSLLA